MVGTLHRFEINTSGFDIPLQACVVKVALSIASISSYCPEADWMLSPLKTNRTAMPPLDVPATACGLGECAAAGVGPADLPRRRFRAATLRNALSRFRGKSEWSVESVLDGLEVPSTARLWDTASARKRAKSPGISSLVWHARSKAKSACASACRFRHGPTLSLPFKFT